MEEKNVTVLLRYFYLFRTIENQLIWKKVDIFCTYIIHAYSIQNFTFSPSKISFFDNRINCNQKISNEFKFYFQN